MIPFPLQWPDSLPRYSRQREAGQFRTSLQTAIKNVKDSLRLFAADSGKVMTNIVISSNATLGVDKPADPGVAVWFIWDGLTVCIPVDRYAKIEANLQAIHYIVEARRVELRHGTLALVRASFTGFLALPSPEKRTWRDVLGNIPPHQNWRGVGPANTREQIEAAYRRLAKDRHPDTGGSQEAMSELNRARDEALKEIGA